MAINSKPFNDDDYLRSSVTDRPDFSCTGCSSKEHSNVCLTDLPIFDANANSCANTLTELFDTSRENFVSRDVITEKLLP